MNTHHPRTVFEDFSVKIRQGMLLVNKIDIAKLDLPPQCIKIMRFSSLAQPEVGSALDVGPIPEVGMS